MSFRIVLVSMTLLMTCSKDAITETTQVEESQAEETLAIIPVEEISSALSDAPYRVGPLPETPDGIPHQQHNQNSPVAMQEALQEAASALPGIFFEPTPYSFSGSIGWRLEQSYAQGSPGAFIRESLEFCHQHVPSDGSLHMLLPQEFADVALEKGWGVIHPLTDDLSGERSEYVMIFGPRDDDELDIIWIIAQISYYQARGLGMAIYKEG